MKATSRFWKWLVTAEMKAACLMFEGMARHSKNDKTKAGLLAVMMILQGIVRLFGI